MAAFLKGLGALPLLITYLFTSGILSILPMHGRSRRAMRMQNTSFFSKLALALFGFRVQVKHHERLHNARGGRLLVSNHLSYADVLVISAFSPAVFITSVELKHTVLLGILARFGGSLFVERRKPTGLKKEIAGIARILDQGFPVVLFPEGTTSNGDRVQQFKNSLFDSAVSTGVDVQPLCLRYVRVNGELVTAQNRDAVFYYGGTTFFRHFPRFLSLKSVEVDVIPLKAIKVHASISRKELAKLAHDAIDRAYHA